MRFLLYILLLTQTLDAMCQKIVLKGSGKRAVVKPGTLVGITLVGEPFSLNSWKYRCVKSDSISEANKWVVTKITETHLVAEQYPSPDSAYSFDTITDDVVTTYMQTHPHAKFLSNAARGSQPKINLWVFKNPKQMVIGRFPFVEIESLTFAKSKNCSATAAHVFIVGPGLMIMSGGALAGSGRLSWPIAILGGAGATITWLIFRSVRRDKVRTYSTKEFPIRVR